jgi:2-polyprenyl-6-methoxyphenol hydroxylase-like FAD-dependent oxidoreductase
VSKQPSAPSAIVIGGSIAGLFAGLSLLRAGWRVNVYERSRTELSGRGAGINTHPELITALGAIGAETGQDLGVISHWRRLLSPEGKVLTEFPAEQVNISWDRMHGVLRRLFPDLHYYLGANLVGCREAKDSVVAVFSDGTKVEADLLVGADGFRSSVRGVLLPEVQPAYVGYVAWRGMVEERQLSPEVHSQIFDAFAFSLVGHEEILGYPVTGPGDDLRPGHGRYNVVWYRPANEADELPRLLTDANGTRHELSIPPPLIAPAVIAEMREAALRLPPAFTEVMLETASPFLQPIYDCESPRMAIGRCVLVGDAAFVARPHVGAGVTKAAEDALSLARALTATRDVDAALAAFELERLAVNRRIITQTRRLGAVLEPGRGAREQLPTPDDLLRDTASLAWLRAST